MTDFERLVGQEFDFYGVDNTTFKLNDTIWNAIEDESDGYRSYLGSVEAEVRPDSIYFDRPLARVMLVWLDEYTEKDQSGRYDALSYFSGWRLVDVVDGHVWLTVGTDQMHDYYPCFMFTYNPKLQTT